MLLLNRIFQERHVGVDSEKRVFERGEEADCAPVALTRATPRKLPVNAHALAVLRAYYKQPAKLLDALAELDVGAAACHVRRDCDRAHLPRAGNYSRLEFVVCGVEFVVRNAPDFEHSRQHFRVVHRRRYRKHGLPRRFRADYFVDYGVEFFPAREVYEVGQLLPYAGLVRRNAHGLHSVDFAELVGLAHCRSGHARDFFEHLEEVLNADCGVCSVFGLYVDALLCFNRLMEVVAPAASLHDAPRVGVDYLDLAVFYNIVNVLFVERIRLKQLVEGENPVGAFGELPLLGADGVVFARGVHRLVAQYRLYVGFDVVYKEH